MLTFKLNIGMASKYFIVDLQRCISTMESPYVFLSKALISVPILSENLTRIYNHGLSSGILGLGVKKLEAQKAELLLNDFINEREPSGLIQFQRAIFIVANGIDKMALLAMKILKIRGLCLLLAIDASGAKHDETIFRLEMELKTNAFFKDTDCSLYAPTKGFAVVGGVNETVITNEMTVKEVIRQNLTLTMTYDEKAMFEPLK
jgi:hypothetical protein